MNKVVHPTFRPVLLSANDAAAGIRLFRFASPTGFRFTPGQFLMFHFVDDPKTCRAYSLCSSPTMSEASFEVTVGMVGEFSARLGALKPGQEGGLVVRGPFGKWVYDGADPHAVLVSGGTGLTPFRAMCRMKIEQDLAGKITLCCAAKTPEDLLYKDEYDGWRQNGTNVKERVTQPGADAHWNDKTGCWTAAAVFAAANDAAAVYYLCGPNKMVQELRDGLQKLGVSPQNVRTEKWGDYTELF